MLNRISKFLNENDYDLRKHKDTAGRWIDQKCTPDVVWSISDFILNYIENVKNIYQIVQINICTNVILNFLKERKSHETYKHKNIQIQCV